MAATMGQFRMGFTVRDGEDFDAVSEELADVIYDAVKRWYDEKGKALLACEPT